MADPRDLPFPALRGGAVITVGTFDGVHAGHRDILTALARRARAESLPSVLVTFRPHPLAVVNPLAAPRLLTAGREQMEALAGECAPEYVIVVPFTPTLASFGAEQFVRELLIERYRMRSLVIGYDHGLGRGREGNVASLVALGDRLGFPVEVVPARIGAEGLPISSTSIRRAVAYGDLRAAAAALGRPYSVQGRVIRGDDRGKSLGYPTLNLEIPAEKLLPPEGVYAIRVRSAAGAFGGMMNLGGRPTFGDASLSLEAHLFDASGDWYGLDVTLEFVLRIRDVMRFSGAEALIAQLGRDAESAHRALTQA